MELQDFITRTAREAGKIVMRHYGKVKTPRTKGDRGDIVTEVDIKSEDYIVERIRSAFPRDSIISEEAGHLGEARAEHTWLVDPLDGTRNYALGIPFFSISIALAKGGAGEAGAVYDPLHDEMFYAARGEGATMNGMPIEVSAEPHVEDALISVSWLRRRVDQSRFVGYIDRISRRTSYFRRLGSAALIAAYVAAGRVDAYIQGAINPWDIAAGTVLVSEAGGTLTDFEGNPIDLTRPYTDIVAAGPALHRQLLEEVIRG